MCRALPWVAAAPVPREGTHSLGGAVLEVRRATRVFTRFTPSYEQRRHSRGTDQAAVSSVDVINPPPMTGPRIGALLSAGVPARERAIIPKIIASSS
jgi:hypothetical protein